MQYSWTIRLPSKLVHFPLRSIDICTPHFFSLSHSFIKSSPYLTFRQWDFTYPTTFFQRNTFSQDEEWNTATRSSSSQQKFHYPFRSHATLFSEKKKLFSPFFPNLTWTEARGIGLTRRLSHNYLTSQVNISSQLDWSQNLLFSLFRSLDKIFCYSTF